MLRFQLKGRSIFAETEHFTSVAVQRLFRYREKTKGEKIDGYQKNEKRSTIRQ